MRVLVVTAVPAERDAVLAKVPAGAGLTCVAGGVGVAAAAAATAVALERSHYDRVLSAGIAGGFAGRARPGDVVIADRVVAADLGCRTDSGFLPLPELGLDTPVAYDCPPLWSAPTGAVHGTVLSLTCMTGTEDRAAELAAAHPHAVAEAMEGFGVATAAAAAGVPFAEVRTISNLIGRRDRSAWDIPAAFAALGAAFAILSEAL
jgi:futalosine hydrolase